MEGPILAAEVIAFLLQQRSQNGCFDEFVDVLCSFFRGRGGAAPTKGDLTEARSVPGRLGEVERLCRQGQGYPG